MPLHRFLSSTEPLARRVAKVLCEEMEGKGMFDFSKWTVLTPTSGAARRIRSALAELAAERNTGVLPPVFESPMAHLERVASATMAIATRVESLVAWVNVLLKARPEDFPNLLGRAGDYSDMRSAWSLASSLERLSDLLTEGGLSPASPVLAEVMEPEAGRWEDIARLFEHQQKELQKYGMIDANTAKRAIAHSTPHPSGPIVVAAIPDLPLLVESYLTQLEKKGVPVYVLIDCPEGTSELFDAWGRPDVTSWSGENLSIPTEYIVVEAGFADEARRVAEIFSQMSGRSAGLAVADSTLIPAIEGSLRRIGLKPFDPSGRALATTEPGAIVLGWLDFLSTNSLRDLRVFLEKPRILNLAARQTNSRHEADILNGLDELASFSQAGTLPDALEAITSQPASSEKKTKLSSLVAACAEEWRKKFDVAQLGTSALRDLLREAYEKGIYEEESFSAAALEEFDRIFTQIENSPILRAQNDPDGHFLRATLTSAIEQSRVYARRGEDDLEVNGWLEAPWMDEEFLLLSGCTDGALPDVVVGHAFIPDSVRAKLGLMTNEQRLVRDLYLLRSLTITHPRGRLVCTLSRTGAEGDPLKPSRLFFRVEDKALPDRVNVLFATPEQERNELPRSNAWQLEVPRHAPPKHLSVTRFALYLRCPLRFYLQHVAKMEPFEAPSQELDAREFGSLLHAVVEDFGRDTEEREKTDENAIRRFVEHCLELRMRERFGSNPPLKIRIQKEILHRRLGEFARIQAQERREGWLIVEAERSITIDDELTLGGLPLTAKIDRIEIHEKTGRRRILDYKTSAKGAPPIETHFIRANGEPFFPEMDFEESADEKPIIRRWKDLQLPLYRWIASHLWPNEPPPLTAYFNLPARLEGSGIAPLELDENTQMAAEVCAQAIAERILRGIFLPAARITANRDDFAGLFFGDQPESRLTPASIEFLQGGEQ